MKDITIILDSNPIPSKRQTTLRYEKIDILVVPNFDMETGF